MLFLPVSSFFVFLILVTLSESRKCESFEVFTEFADPSCEATCDNYMEELACLSDSGACFCREPNVRDVLTNKCIHPRECSNRKLTRNNKIEGKESEDGFINKMKNYYYDVEDMGTNAKNRFVNKMKNYYHDVKDGIMGTNNKNGFINKMKNSFYDFKDALTSKLKTFVN